MTEPSQELTRRIELEGVFNARDLGGLAAGDGRLVRRGALFRSDSPQLLSAAAVHHLVHDLGLRTVLDLRYPDESEREGIGALSEADGVVHVNIPVRAGDASFAPASPFVNSDAERPPAWEFTFAYYQGYFLAHDGAGVVESVKALAAADALPALVHCAAGKDRTGVVVAVVLAAVGVSSQDIAADYAETAHAVPDILRRLSGLPSYAGVSEAQLEYHLTHPETMAALLAWTDSELGGIRPWLLAHGVTEDELDTLRERLTEPVAGEAGNER